MYFWNDRDELLKERDALRAQLAACKAQRDALAEIVERVLIGVKDPDYTWVFMKTDADTIARLIDTIADDIQATQDAERQQQGQQEEE